MILPNFTEKEMTSEYLADMREVLAFSDKLDQKWRRAVIKATRFPLFSTPRIYTSKRNNRWIVLLEARSKKEYGEFSRITFVCVVNDRRGYYAIMHSFVGGQPIYIFYAPHFFSRFRDRAGCEANGIELIAEFFRLNASYVFDFKDDSEGGTHVYGSTKEGVAMGMLSEHKNILFKTFVTYEMLKGEQVDVFTKNEAIRQEIHEGI